MSEDLVIEDERSFLTFYTRPIVAATRADRGFLKPKPIEFQLVPRIDRERSDGLAPTGVENEAARSVLELNEDCSTQSQQKRTPAKRSIVQSFTTQISFICRLVDFCTFFISVGDIPSLC